MTFAQEPLAQIQSSDNKEVAIVQEPLVQIQDADRGICEFPGIKSIIAQSVVGTEFAG